MSRTANAPDLPLPAPLPRRDAALWHDATLRPARCRPDPPCLPPCCRRRQLATEHSTWIALPAQYPPTCYVAATPYLRSDAFSPRLFSRYRSTSPARAVRRKTPFPQRLLKTAAMLQLVRTNWYHLNPPSCSHLPQQRGIRSALRSHQLCKHTKRHPMG